VAPRLPKCRLVERWIEIVVGRLMTDEEFRHKFSTDPLQALAELRDRGTHLTHVEIAALLAIDPALWERAASQIDPRLQKASLKNE
jgi:hypothetical protein